MTLLPAQSAGILSVDGRHAPSRVRVAMLLRGWPDAHGTPTPSGPDRTMSLRLGGPPVLCMWDSRRMHMPTRPRRLGVEGGRFH